MNDLKFYIHDDIDYAAKYYNIPITMWNIGDVYILQGNRLVWFGNKRNAEMFVKRNKGQYIKAIFWYR